MTPNTQSGNRRRSRTSPRSFASSRPPASNRTIDRYTSAAAKVEIIEVPTANREGHRSTKYTVETKPIRAARTIGGPRLFAGASVYIITARKMNASATDLWVWLMPSTLVTGTVNRLETRVRTSSPANASRPLQPRIGKRTVHKTPSNSNPVPATATLVIRSRLFQFIFDILTLSN